MFSFFVQPAAKKGADKSGPGAGISVLSEKALFLGQKVGASLLSLLKTKLPCKLQGIIPYSHEIFNEQLIIMWLQGGPWLCTILQGPVVLKSTSANPGLNFNLGFFFFSSKVLSCIIFYIVFRVSNHQIVGKEN